MMNRIKKLLTEEHGAATTDIVALTGFVMALTTVLVATAQHELVAHMTTIETALTPFTRVD